MNISMTAKWSVRHAWRKSHKTGSPISNQIKSFKS
jgi:hypothetical protein